MATEMTVEADGRCTHYTHIRTPLNKSLIATFWMSTSQGRHTLRHRTCWLGTLSQESCLYIPIALTFKHHLTTERYIGKGKVHLYSATFAHMLSMVALSSQGQRLA